jgi:hypothetical protein
MPRTYTHDCPVVTTDLTRGAGSWRLWENSRMGSQYVQQTSTEPLCVMQNLVSCKSTALSSLIRSPTESNRHRSWGGQCSIADAWSKGKSTAYETLLKMAAQACVHTTCDLMICEGIAARAVLKENMMSCLTACMLMLTTTYSQSCTARNTRPIYR